MLSAHSHVVLTIDEPMDQVIAPLDRVGMKFITRALDLHVHARLLVERPFEPVVCRQENALSRCAGINDFHDVEFTAASPGSVGGIGRQHPNR